MSRDLYRVYVDEAGDRGWGGSSSPIFNLSAVIVRDSDVEHAEAIRKEICIKLGKPFETVLHWSENIRAHPARKFVSTEIAPAPITISSVVVNKQSLIGTGTALSDPAKQYNYAVRRLLERVSWCVDELNGEAIVTFAHIRRFPYEKLHSYLELLKTLGSEIRWPAIRKVRIDQPIRKPLLQVADITAGCTHSAFRRDQFGDHEAGYLMALAPRIYTRPPGHVSSYGMNLIGINGREAPFPWWSEFCSACETS
jgi:hypothetical protein